MKLILKDRTTFENVIVLTGTTVISVRFEHETIPGIIAAFTPENLQTITVVRNAEEPEGQQYEGFTSLRSVSIGIDDRVYATIKKEN